MENVFKHLTYEEVCHIYTNLYIYIYIYGWSRVQCLAISFFQQTKKCLFVLER